MPGSAPSVDVVIATHHRPDMLRRALDAVLEQTYDGDITVIVVFDQTELDRSLASEAPGRRVVVIPNTRTPGLAGARNSGIVHGTSALVGFCDDDDFWRPTKLASQVARMTADGAPTCVTGITVNYGDRSNDRIPTAEQMTLDNLVRHRVMAAHPSSVVIERSTLETTVGLVDEEIPGSYGEDFDFILRAAAAGPIAVVEEPLVDVTWGQSLFSRKWGTIVEAIDYVIVKHAAFGHDDRALARLYGRRAFALAAIGRRREALSTAWRTFRLSPREQRTYLAAAVAGRLVSAERLMDIAHRRGHGI